MKSLSISLFVVVLLLVVTGSVYAGYNCWTLGYFTDDFGERTKDTFIEIETEGVFSNSATPGDKLYVEVLVSKDGIDGKLALIEYKKYRNPQYFIGGGYFKLKNSAGEVKQYRLPHKWNQQGAMWFNAGDFIKFMKKSVGQVQCIAYDEYSSLYKFKLNAYGFTKAYNEMRSGE